MPNPDPQDEMRRALADEIERAMKAASLLSDEPFRQAMQDLGRVVYPYTTQITAALRAQPERAAEEWSYDKSAAPQGKDKPVLVTVPSLHPGLPPMVGEAWRCNDEGSEGWWWAGTFPDDYFHGPIRETNAEPIAWRHLPEPAALPLSPAGEGAADA